MKYGPVGNRTLVSIKNFLKSSTELVKWIYVVFQVSQSKCDFSELVGAL